MARGERAGDTPGAGGSYGSYGRRGRPGRARRDRDRGSAAIEFLGFLPLLLVIGLAAIQLGLAAFAAQQAGSAARAAARTATLDDSGMSPEGAGKAAVSGWLAGRTDVGAALCDGGGQTTGSATVEIPAVLPFDFGTATRTATMPCPADPRSTP
ncbi:TadE/TadG family type IV pilus assembly protein [Streptomyces sp. NPDC050610]|uniref:TadE/TadG family type IV pilus assembly protein n=1 Tax=Streptomyces sp. NPDC050610 TaxID=3157097 RepID=UPI003418A1F8